MFSFWMQKIAIAKIAHIPIRFYIHRPFRDFTIFCKEAGSTVSDSSKARFTLSRMWDSV